MSYVKRVCDLTELLALSILYLTAGGYMISYVILESSMTGLRVQLYKPVPSYPISLDRKVAGSELSLGSYPLGYSEAVKLERTD